MNKTIKCITENSLPENIDLEVGQLMNMQHIQSYEELYGLYLSQDKSLKLFAASAACDMARASAYMTFVENILGSETIKQLTQDAEDYKNFEKNFGLFQHTKQDK